MLRSPSACSMSTGGERRANDLSVRRARLESPTPGPTPAERGRGREAWLALVLLGCAANLDTPGGETIAVRGRVIDPESCASTAGCTGVAGMVVRLGADPERVFSQPSASDGTFELRGVPVGYPHDLVVTPDPSALDSVVPTRNPMMIARDQIEDVYNLEVYVMRNDPPSLIATIRAEGIDLALSGGYFGQVVQIEGGNVTAAEGVRAVVAPAPRQVRYVNYFLRFYMDGEPRPPALRDPAATETGLFGAFVVEPEGATDPVAILPLQDGWEYDLVVAPLVPGFVTYALHRGTPAL